jgi:predicted nucleotide-binding protein (sugar kinase/HSP70/actin superfamily)
MQRTLYTLQTAILWAQFFDKLGYRLVLTPPTNAEISKLGVSAASFESCYPVKNSIGHLKLLANNTKYIFVPSMIDMPISKETNGGLYCPMVQSNFYMAKTIIKMDKSSTILDPVVHLKYSPDILASELHKQIGNKLGKSKSDIKKALDHAIEMQNNFIRELHQIGANRIKSRNENEPIVIVTGRPYNLYDETLNLKIGKNLSKIGINAIPMDFINTSESNESDFSFMYWGHGVKILKTAEYIKKNQNLFGIHLTNFSCGPDSFIEHFYKNIMENKPYLILELDEHSATAGMITRLEAYKNIIDN